MKKYATLLLATASFPALAHDELWLHWHAEDLGIVAAAPLAVYIAYRLLKSKK
jgi:hypothetical protein|tara:strand:+ start:19523 stop:19681 length:159 start_codon:yes stop_codon:yes gene_type:complete